MLINLVQDMNHGDHFHLTLNFEEAGSVNVEVVVREP
jgi:copper(I)-binding protein